MRTYTNIKTHFIKQGYPGYEGILCNQNSGKNSKTTKKESEVTCNNCKRLLNLRAIRICKKLNSLKHGLDIESIEGM